MSYFPKKGMYRDDNGVARFVDGGHPSAGPVGKQWFRGEVVRRQYDGKGEVTRKNKQAATVFAREAEVAGYLFARCPDPWSGSDGGRTTVEVYYEPLGDQSL